MNQKTKAAYLSAIVLALALGFASLVAVAKSDNSQSSGGGNSAKAKSEKAEKLKDYEKPTAGKSNAVIYRENTDEVSAGLLEAAEIEKNNGQQDKIKNTNENKVNNPNVGEQKQTKTRTSEEIAEELEEAAEVTEESQDGTVEAIEEVENQNGFKKFLIGTDYKNLGQLRSSLVHNRNQIRKLAKLSEEVTDEAAQTALAEQMTALMQERERIKTVISENEEGFSLLGWIFRFMNGYPAEPIDEKEEETLVQEVELAIDNASIATDATVPAAPATSTIPADTATPTEATSAAPVL